MSRHLCALLLVAAIATPVMASDGLSVAMYYSGANGVAKRFVVNWTIYDGKAATKAECETMLPAITAFYRTDMDKRELGTFLRSECVNSSGTSARQE